MKVNTKTEWFKTWFNSPYYHILYQYRDHEEAQLFVKNLTDHYCIGKEDTILDLGCGEGRHAVSLNESGADVYGIDIAPENINRAKQYANCNLHFEVFDMRNVYKKGYFNYVFSFFTSLGYFDIYKDNIKVFKSIYDDLKPGGVVVLDFFNVQRVIADLESESVKEISGIRFIMNRKIEGNQVIKTIQVIDKKKKYHFYEKVSLFDFHAFKELLVPLNFEIKNVWGDYNLSPFNPENSNRLIIAAQKVVC